MVKDRRKLIIRSMLGLIVVLIGFGIGYLIGNYNLIKFNAETNRGPNIIAVVNEDQSQVYADQTLKYSDKIINKLLEKKGTGYEFEIVSNTKANRGVESDYYSGILKIPSTLSQSVISINEKTPQKTYLEYTLNDSLSNERKYKVQVDFQQFLGEVNKALNYIYTYGIFGEIHATQEKAEEVLENAGKSIEYMDVVSDINLLDGHSYKLEPTNKEVHKEVDLNESKKELNNIYQQYNEEIISSKKDFDQKNKEKNDDLKENSREYYTSDVQVVNDNIGSLRKIIRSSNREISKISYDAIYEGASGKEGKGLLGIIKDIEIINYYINYLFDGIEINVDDNTVGEEGSILRTYGELQKKEEVFLACFDDISSGTEEEIIKQKEKCIKDGAGKDYTTALTNYQNSLTSEKEYVNSEKTKLKDPTTYDISQVIERGNKKNKINSLIKFKKETENQVEVEATNKSLKSDTSLHDLVLTDKNELKFSYSKKDGIVYDKDGIGQVSIISSEESQKDEVGDSELEMTFEDVFESVCGTDTDNLSLMCKHVQVLDEVLVVNYEKDVFQDKYHLNSKKDEVLASNNDPLNTLDAYLTGYVICGNTIFGKGTESCPGIAEPELKEGLVDFRTGNTAFWREFMDRLNSVIDFEEVNNEKYSELLAKVNDDINEIIEGTADENNLLFSKKIDVYDKNQDAMSSYLTDLEKDDKYEKTITKLKKLEEENNKDSSEKMENLINLLPNSKVNGVENTNLVDFMSQPIFAVSTSESVGQLPVKGNKKVFLYYGVIALALGIGTAYMSKKMRKDNGKI